MQQIQTFFSEHFFTILLVIGLAYGASRFAMMLVHRIVEKSLKPDKFKTERDEHLRKETLTGIIGAIIRGAIWIIAAMMLLSELGVNIAPMLAGAGIIGAALGFGGQSMVKDYLAGIFIISENQYRVGDVVELNKEVSGVVEHVTMRATVLRDLDGMLHHVPNGNITIATNMTMDYANINFDIGVAYDTDLDKVEKIINEVGLELAGDEQWKRRITEPPAMLRVDNFGESEITLKILGKTIPMEQWAATGELRKRLKKAFDKNGIEIPFPQRTIHQAK